MKRFEEKVKDIVEVRPFNGLTDFATDAEATMAGYYFTDGTSAMMAKWLDIAARVSDQNGSAMALAGYRGVGKSHFLAVFAAILAKPELRSRISDSHVSAGMQTLMRRRYPVIYVRRGSKPTLHEEFLDGLAGEFGNGVFKPTETAIALLEAAAFKAGDLPLVIIVDTSIDRGVRVTRDDGEVLSQLANRAKELNVMMCVALDDDIEGADGSNASIARTFSIDFLDQEHLYKVVNLNVFPKRPNVENNLTELYDFFRSVVPKFRWSPQRFAALYPLHPGIMEVAPYIRLFVHDFALLGFAAEAGERILGRPANSLIAFDEVFDRAEPNLRKIEDLQRAFAAYDKLNSEIVSKIPVMQRLQAKLILKALLLLSLDGRGATVEDICASMLIYDEAAPERVIESVKGIIEKFSAAMPEDIAVRQFAGGDPHYAFRVSSKDDLNTALQESIAQLPADTVENTIKRLLHDRFTDLAFFQASDGRSEMDCTTYWRGSQRRGRIYWLSDGTTDAGQEGTNENFDWEVDIRFGAGAAEPAGERIQWLPDGLRPEEEETVKRFHVLQHDASLSARFGEHVRPALHAHRVAAEKIAERVMLENSKLIVDGFDFNFSEEARAARTVSDLLSVMLDPHFESRFPSHPVFAQRLGMSEVSRLVTDLYVGSKRSDTEVQVLAEVFGAPLGLVRREGEAYVPEQMEALAGVPAIKEILNAIEGAADGQVPLSAIYQLLRRPPLGFAREAQHLMLAALVAERKIEFVTSRGDRINHRSLDLRIIWDDIVGIAKIADNAASARQLSKWAGIITGDASFKSLEPKGERDRLLTAFRTWLADWDGSNVLMRFENTSASRLNTREWAHATRVRNTLGIVADELRNAVRGAASPEECLTRIAATFSDSEEELQKSLDAGKHLEHYLDAVETRGRVLDYLTAAEMTGRPDIEAVRESLIIAVEQAVAEPGEARNREAGYLWERFRREYSEFYAQQHDETMRSHDLQEKYAEIRRSAIWHEFRELSRIALFRGPAMQTAASLCARLDQLDCRFELRKALGQSSTCICGFRLDESAKWRELPSELWGTIKRALDHYRSVLVKRREDVTAVLETFISETRSTEHAEAAGRLRALLADGRPIPGFSGHELQVLQIVLEPNFDNGRLYVVDSEVQVEAEALVGHDAAEVVVEDAVVVEI